VNIREEDDRRSGVLDRRSDSYHRLIDEVERRVAYLEAFQVDTTKKIVDLVDGLNELNLNLTKLTTSINIAIRTVLLGAAFATTSLAGLWGYHTFITSQIHETASDIQQFEQHNLKDLK
jgi:predicted DNA binding CopG/RHH family protein